MEYKGILNEGPPESPINASETSATKCKAEERGVMSPHSAIYQCGFCYRTLTCDTLLKLSKSQCLSIKGWIIPTSRDFKYGKVISYVG